MVEFIALVVIGTLAGMLAGLLGIGGGLLIVPAMTALLIAQGAGTDVAVPMAVATALGSMLLTSAASAWSHSLRGTVDWSAVVRLGPAVALGAVLGAWLATAVSGIVLARIFALFTALIGLRMLVGGADSARPVTSRVRAWFLVGPAIGAVSAMIGIGGGSFNVPYLNWNGYSTLRAVGIAAACGWPIALAGSAGFVVEGWDRQLWPSSFGYLYLPGVILIGIFGSLSAPLGARLAHRIGSTALARVFGIFLLIVAVRMAWQ
ncbi:MAG: sulfite exporter TauE/SafE family protein [Wenzhouxiangellaceae bacterium]|nr:sulfite exporter TauE/SafE family protein [Wenzhouxiangellaceae bacterium]MBS3747052.1 sulfite exporter TauE/SafE family protein [Wenzhouxiangellaceae bacterium]MBS3823836.1 sulfite exporter TauE/SafE family protein [Wenzhouxiangellaceae bacterium]